ncbi:MAG: alpha-amylase family glycosyl hydrolase [Chitinophagaceae bacterium]
MTIANNGATPSAKPLPVSGMGSILHTDGTFFRVWAPHAKKIFVAGEFNGWSQTANEMTLEGNGYWGIDIPTAKGGQQYKYILQTDEGMLYRNDPYAKEISTSYGNSVIIDTDFNWEDKDFKTPSWNEMVIYEMHIGTFNRKEKGKPGTFYSVIEKLPYLKTLGINVIEIMPPIEFSGGVSWGYNPSHPFAIEREYGGVEGFKQLVNEAHKLGIAIVLDIVYNHFGPGDLDLWRFDGWSENEGGGIYFYQDWRKNTPWGDSRPDYGRPEVRQYIRDNALMWLEEYHVDGLRTDAIAYIRNVNGGVNPLEDIPEGWSLMQWINKEVKEKFPWKIIIAEDLKCNPWITKSQEEGGEGFSTQWDAAFVHPVRSLLAATQDDERDMKQLEAAITTYYNEDAFQRVIYTESHDEVANGKTRVPQEISPDDSTNWFAKKRSVLGAAITFTSPGIPMIFMGQESLEGGWFSDEDPIDWARANDFKGIVKLYRDLISLRTNSKGFSKGLTGQETKVTYLNDTEKIMAWQRWSEDGAKDSVMIVINMADKSHQDFILPFPEEGLWKIRFNSDWKGYDETFTDSPILETETFESNHNEKDYNATIHMGPYNALILSRD